MFLSSAFLLRMYDQWKLDFLYWYSLGVALIALGLCAVFLETSVGSPLGWVGRSAQYLGGVFWLVSLVAASRSSRYKGLPIERVIASFFADAEAGYRNLVETANDAIISYDQEGRIISWNPAAEKMFGYTIESAIGQPFLELFIPERHFAVLQEETLRAAAPSKLSLSDRIEIEGRRRDGSLFPIEASVSVRHLPTGRVATLILRDVTERKQADDAAERLSQPSETNYRISPGRHHGHRRTGDSDRME